VVAIPIVAACAAAANRLFIERNQRRHLVVILAVDALRRVCEEGLRNDVSRRNKSRAEATVLLERLLRGHKGGEAVEVKLDVQKGIVICEKHLAESPHILAKAGVRQSKEVMAPRLCVIVLYPEGIVHTLHRHLIEQGGVLRMGEEHREGYRVGHTWL